MLCTLMSVGQMDGKVGASWVTRGVCDYWIRQWREIDPRVEPVGFTTDEQGHIIVKVHQVVRDLEGKVVMDGMVDHVYLIEKGLIRSVEIRKDGRGNQAKDRFAPGF